MKDNAKNEIYERLSEIIGSDKSAMDKESRALALRDFTYVASEYFDLLTQPDIGIESVEGVYFVTLKFKANRVRACKTVKC